MPKNDDVALRLVQRYEMLMNEGLHVAVDTCGFAPREDVLAVARRADLLLWDVKTLDPTRHRDLAGVPLEPILGNLEAVSRLGVPIWLRFPVIPGVNDDDEGVELDTRGYLMQMSEDLLETYVVQHIAASPGATITFAVRTEKESSPEKTRASILPSGFIHLVGKPPVSPGPTSHSAVKKAVVQGPHGSGAS